MTKLSKKAVEKRLGWIRDELDHRDLDAPLRLSLHEIPQTADLSGKFPPVYDQKNLGSCTANMGGGIHQFTMMEQGKVAPLPARLQLYYCTRSLMGTVNEDSGASIRDTFKAMAQFGVAKESLWPYKVSDYKKKPSAAAMADAAKKQAIKYMRVAQTEQGICDAVASGDPVGFGFSVYNGFNPGKNNVIPLPGKRDRSDGGHAIVIVGYDRGRRLFKIRNSWGEGWGNKGYAWMPFDYVLNPKLASDFWILQAVE